jgi:hypothetical protein
VKKLKHNPKILDEKRVPSIKQMRAHKSGKLVHEAIGVADRDSGHAGKGGAQEQTKGGHPESTRPFKITNF